MYFVISASPRAAPSRAQWRVVGRSATVIAARNSRAQASWSNDTVWNIAFAPRRNGVKAEPKAVTATAVVPPPSRRQIRQATTITPTPARIANERRPTSESPNSACDSRASQAVTGGKSTYPAAGCSPASR